MTVSRRHLLMTVVMLISIGLGGCITTNPAVQADTSNSTVFEQFSAAEPWTSGKVRTSTTLSYNATRSLGITEIVVINERGTVVSTSTIDAGQTSVILMLPVNQNVTVVAMNDTGYAIENQTVTTVSTVSTDNAVAA